MKRIGDSPSSKRSCQGRDGSVVELKGLDSPIEKSQISETEKIQGASEKESSRGMLSQKCDPAWPLCVYDFTFRLMYPLFHKLSIRNDIKYFDNYFSDY